MKCTVKLVALSLKGPYPHILRTVSDWAVDLPTYQTSGGTEGFYTWPLLSLKGWAVGTLNTATPFENEQEGIEVVFENDEESLTFLFLTRDFIGFIDRLERDGKLMGHNWDLNEMADYISQSDEEPRPVNYSYGPEHLI